MTGRAANKDAGVGSSKNAIITAAKLAYKRKRRISLEILIAVDRFVEIEIPTPFAKALGISSEAILETQITALGVTDTIKRFEAAKSKTEENTVSKRAGWANTRDTESTPLSQTIMGTQYSVKLHTPIKNKKGGKFRSWYSVRVPQAVSIAAFSLFIARFATADKMPLGFTPQSGKRLYYPWDSTEGLTKIVAK
ncbi:MAG: hypothetical protein F6K40_23975 [Okeania sp. SIO3I5]|uniref:hypothetical protein n=1 Tax=Okeania sp. SIO3I5 TaxID=2607805 RepID=UPI0013BA28A1|nr:hypothetical protein [Okeania sp. SIO3I5]NEQ39144.1 hypothetical protein [Okeania sp. SIO3I5]